MDTMPTGPYNKSSFGMKCMKFLLILINVLYLIISFLMISGATTLKVIFGEHYFELWYASTVDSLSSLWIATGCFLLALSIFGMAAAIKESTLMTNFYGLFLCLIFILQMAAAITGFTLITQADGIVRQTLQSMMYNSFSGQDTIDWIQRTFECCGNDAPSDWENLGRFYGSYTTREYDYFNDSTQAYSTLRMPKSCCQPNSNYDMNYYTCERYFTRGCHGPVNSIVSQSVMMIGSSALAVGVVQILGVVCAFMYARIIRRNKTNRDIHRWAIHESMGFDRPAFVDRTPNSETIDGEKHI
ncbi:CD63 antigen [Pseudolycoriella hygida]|uniref:Tetraspanin n=1 Tax=Pseudolycoriella hygida TaxID=35572 RepID=A0A9Q0RUS6_9DIPT|nr:CD63 antigen [Pseudolycoriella hygida]